MEAICSMYSEVLGQCLSRFWRELCNALAGIFRLAAKLYSAPVTAAAERAAINERAEYILNTYGDSILRYAYSYLHNMSDAEDILQDTLIQYLKTGPVFENAAHEKAWLLRVAANLSKNRLDYNSIRKTDELNEELAADERDDLSFVWEAVKSLPVTPEQTEYISYWHELAEIDYTGEGKTACYRKAAGTEDCSGDYNVYTDVTEFEESGMTVMLKGDAGQYTLAIWTDGSYSYSLSLSDGLSLSDWQALMNSIQS